MTDRENEDLFPWEVPEAPPAMEAAGPTAAPPPPSRKASPEASPRPERRDERGARDRSAATPARATAGPAVEQPAAVAREDAEPAPPRDRPVVPREYYSISEVCEIVGLKPHVLRYWETQFGPLNPSKNRSGNRVYQRKEIRLILLVKRLLYEEKFTIDGARSKLDQLRRTGKIREMAGRALDTDTVETIRAELEQLRDILTPPQTT